MVMMNCSTLSRGHKNLAVDPSVNYNAVDPSFTDDPLSHQIKDEKLLSSRTNTVAPQHQPGCPAGHQHEHLYDVCDWLVARH